MKRQLFVVVILALVASGAASDISRLGLSANRIINGVTTTIENHPYQVSLVYFGSHRCGGSIIHEDFVLTAAHCINGISNLLLSYLTIRAGSTYSAYGGTIHEISRATMHSSYVVATYDYDIALIKVKIPFEFGSTIQPIVLAPADYTIPDGTMLQVSGWGYTVEGGTVSPILRVVDVPSMNNTYCGELYAYLTPVTDRMICAAYEEGEKDACQGDSGGPLVEGNTLYGVVSWGDGCARPYQPGVYASVSYLRGWIIEQTKLDFDLL